MNREIQRMRGVHLEELKYSQLFKDIKDSDKEFDFNEDIIFSMGDKYKKLKWGIEKDPPKTSICHWGQRKMLMSEMLLFEKFIDNTDIDIDENGKMKVLYIGAASGIHTRMLDMLYFGLFKWILYDPNEFDSKLVKYSKIYDTDINFINQYFTVEKSKKFIDFTSGGIFISDLRTETDDQSIMENLKLQNDCAKIMLPSVSYLKFRMPFYKPAKVETYYSQIVHQIWAKRNSGEMRTVVYRDEWQKSPKIIDIRQYEESIHGFNLINRRTSYNKCKNSYCKCFDCWAEEAVIKQYLGKKANGSDEKGESYVDIMKNFISEFLSSEGTRINHKEFYSYDRSKYNEKKFIEFLEELK